MATVSRADLNRIAKLFPRMKCGPRGSSSQTKAHRRRLQTVTLGASGGLLLFESGAIRETIPVRGDLGAVTVNAQMFLRHVQMHDGDDVIMELGGGGIMLRSGKFKTVIPEI